MWTTLFLLLAPRVWKEERKGVEKGWKGSKGAPGISKKASLFIVWATGELNWVSSTVDIEEYWRPEQLSEEVEQNWVIPLWWGRRAQWCLTSRCPSKTGLCREALLLPSASLGQVLFFRFLELYECAPCEQTWQRYVRKHLPCGVQRQG